MPVARGLYGVSREKMRTRHFAYRTEQAYLYWIRRYVNFHDRKHPREMGSREVEGFLTHLAVGEHVSASTQNQALQALLFLYRHVLEIDLPWLENVTRARRPKRLPVVLTVAEVRSVLAHSMALRGCSLFRDSRSAVILSASWIFPLMPASYRVRVRIVRYPVLQFLQHGARFACCLCHRAVRGSALDGSR